jgi:hypothetical protein
MRASVARTHGGPLADAAIAWIWRSDQINRMFFHEYERAFRESPFTLKSLVPAVDPVPPALERILRFRYPEESRFDVTNVEAVLVKDG